MAGNLLRPAAWDTPKDQQVSVSLDIGIVPADYPGSGQYIITIRAWPIQQRRDADRIAAALREAIEAWLQIRFEQQRGMG